MGNDLSTPRPWFPGLRPGKFVTKLLVCNFHYLCNFFAGDRWALCAVRWYQAQRAGKAPLVKLNATNKKALTIVPQSLLEQYDDRRIRP